MRLMFMLSLHFASNSKVCFYVCFAAAHSFYILSIIIIIYKVCCYFFCRICFLRVLNYGFLQLFFFGISSLIIT